LPLQPIWACAPNGMLTPVVTGKTGVLTPVVPCNSEIHTPPPPDADQGVHYIGNLAADVGIGWRVHKHAGHPICGFNPFPSGSPTFVMATPMMAVSPGSLPMSPSIGSLSRMEHFLPNALLSSDANSNLSMTISDAITPMGGGNQASCSTGPCMTSLQPDDRWVCIPSGMVERRKAQFETTGAQDGGAPVVPDDTETRTTRAEAQFEPPAAADGSATVASEGTELQTMRAVDDGDGWLGCRNEHVHEWCVTSDAYPNGEQKGEKP